MIDYIKGILTELAPTYAVIECGGIGYSLTISLSTYALLQGKKEVRLYVHEAIREDAHQLFGFPDKSERQLFQMLISVSGIGGSTAILILSAMSARELADVIATENAGTLKNVKGIGAKTAQRIIVDLKDKMKNLEGLTAATGQPSLPGGMSSQRKEEAVQALVTLGYPAPLSGKVVEAIIREQPDAPVETIIKMAFKRF